MRDSRPERAALVERARRGSPWSSRRKSCSNCCAAAPTLRRWTPMPCSSPVVLASHRARSAGYSADTHVNATRTAPRTLKSPHYPDDARLPAELSCEDTGRHGALMLAALAQNAEHELPDVVREMLHLRQGKTATRSSVGQGLTRRRICRNARLRYPWGCLLRLMRDAPSRGVIGSEGVTSAGGFWR